LMRDGVRPTVYVYLHRVLYLLPFQWGFNMGSNLAFPYARDHRALRQGGIFPIEICSRRLKAIPLFCRSFDRISRHYSWKMPDVPYSAVVENVSTRGRAAFSNPVCHCFGGLGGSSRGRGQRPTQVPPLHSIRTLSVALTALQRPFCARVKLFYEIILACVPPSTKTEAIRPTEERKG
jgi:hypothetical protein